MLQAEQLTGEKRYLDEARAALQSLQGFGFSVQYQANLLAYGAAACVWFWRRTGETWTKLFLAHLLASFFHNTVFWESDIGGAKHYSVLLGATCLHDGPYMAMYECWESYALICEILEMASGELDSEQEYLMAEYCRRALHRAWHYYPGELAEDLICKKPREGHIDRSFAFPLEDLYAGGDPAGKVGQEIYGCGAAWAFTTGAFRRLEGGALLAAERPFAAFGSAGREATFRLAGRAQDLSRIWLSGGKGKFVLNAGDAAAALTSEHKGGQSIWHVPGQTDLGLTW
jgi:hypothetical protein